MNQIFNVQNPRVLATVALVLSKARTVQVIRISKRDTFEICTFSRFNIKPCAFRKRNKRFSNTKLKKSILNLYFATSASDGHGYVSITRRSRFLAAYQFKKNSFQSLQMFAISGHQAIFLRDKASLNITKQKKIAKILRIFNFAI